MLTTHDKEGQNLYWKECFSGSYQSPCSFPSKQTNPQQNGLNVVVDPELLTTNQHKDTDILSLADVIKS